MIFRRAKLRLAVWFAGVQLVLFAAFGLAVYAYVTTAFDFDPAENWQSAGSEEHVAATAEASFATLRTGLLLAYAALAIVVPLTSYVLASLAIRPIRAAYEAQQRFVDDASHEFRTPLSAIQAQLELALNRPRSVSDYRIAMGRSLAAVAQLDEILDDLLVLSRGEQDANVPMRDVEIGSVLDGALEQLSPGDRARVILEPAPELVVVAASGMLSRAVLNLVTNALRYSPPESSATVSAVRRGALARIVVRDEGIGMSRSDRSRAFDRFWRADSSRSSTGRGLGLSIVSEIVRVHGGRVELTSELGIGTAAAIELPLSR